jgi:hypothetical protein
MQSTAANVETYLLKGLLFFLSADYADFRRFLGFFKRLFLFGFPMIEAKH